MHPNAGFILNNCQVTEVKVIKQPHRTIETVMGALVAGVRVNSPPRNSLSSVIESVLDSRQGPQYSPSGSASLSSGSQNMGGARYELAHLTERLGHSAKASRSINSYQGKP
jgi:hypothetical protein